MIRIQTTSPNTFHTLAASLLCALTLGYSAQAQSVSLLNKSLNDAVRRAQLWGDVPVTSSFCVRPVHASRALGIQNPFGLDPHYDFSGQVDTLSIGDDPIFRNYGQPLVLQAWEAATDSSKGWSLDWKQPILPRLHAHPYFTGAKQAWLQLRATPYVSRIQFNSHHDYGWQDGPMIPNKGLQTYTNFGVWGRVGFLEFQYAPEKVYAANEDVPAPGVRGMGNTSTGRISDQPDRFGTEPYVRTYFGQSYVKAHLGPLAMGVSSENVFWGPGRYSGIVMSENAPGIKHFTIETSKPLSTPWGTLEGQLLTGNKMRSGFIYSSGPTQDGSSLPEVARAQEMDTVFSVITAAVGVWNPIWFPGMSLGITREIWTEGPVSTDASNWDYIALFYSNPFRGAGGGTQAAVDQMASMFFRYVMPESHAEIYGEYGFDDNRYDLEDMLVSPEHSRAYLIGFTKIQPLKGKDDFLQFSYEVTQLEGSKEMINRIQFGYPTFYDSDYNHYGQQIGSGIGNGSNQWILAIDRVKSNRRLGFTYERIARNNDRLYAGQVPWVATWYGFDFTKKYVESSLGLNYEERFGPVLVWGKALLTQTYNWNHWYDPAGTGSPMRANGYNFKSLNLFSGITLLL
jgi:hypothetical protein